MSRPEEGIHPDEFGHVELKQVTVQDRHIIANLLQTLNFPVGKREIMQHFGKYELRWTNQEPIMLDDVISDIPQDHFNDPDELTDAICSVIRMAYGDYAEPTQQIIED
jgi:hypothetical protein